MISDKKLLLYKIDFLKKTSFIFNLFFFLISIFILSSCNNVKKKINDWEKRGLKGNISSLKERHYKPKVENRKIVRMSDELICDSVANSPDETEMPNKIYSQDLKFNNNGFIVTKKNYKNSWNADLYKYEYDKNTLRVFRKGVRDTSFYLMKQEIYNQDGQISELQFYHQAGGMLFKNVYMYNSKKNIEAEVLYSPFWLKPEQTSYSYINSNERVVTTQKNDYNQIIETRREKFYDTNFLKLAQQEYKLDRLGSNTFMFDSSGNLISSISIIFKNNFHNFYTYKFDQKGNWVKRIKYNSDDNSPEEISEREIQYYDKTYSKKDFSFLILGAISCALLIGIIKWIVKKYKFNRQ